MPEQFTPTKTYPNRQNGRFFSDKFLLSTLQILECYFTSFLHEKWGKKNCRFTPINLSVNALNNLVLFLEKRKAPGSTHTGCVEVGGTEVLLEELGLTTRLISDESVVPVPGQSSAPGVKCDSPNFGLITTTLHGIKQDKLIRATL